MGRKTNADHLDQVLQAIRENDGRVRANDIARKLDMHPQAVARLLSAVERESNELLIEDDRGFLGIFKRWW